MALAHPLGNFTINHYAGITLTPEEVRLDVVIDMAEIPTFQERQRIDADGDGDVTEAETAAAAGPACEAQRGLLRLAVDGVGSTLTGVSASIAFPPGVGGLSTMRIECAYVAPLPTPLVRSTVTFEDVSYPDRIGWREIVATGDGVSIDAGELPATSPSARLTAYPTELLTRPLDTSSATIVVSPAPGTGSASPSPRNDGQGGGPDPGGPGEVPGGIGGDLPAVFRSADLTLVVALLSVVTAFGLGVAHALTPGHGKTLMAAYLVGRRGTSAHAVGLGLSVSVSHTLGILVLAAIIVGAEGLLSPDAVQRIAPAVAAVTILAIGGWMLVREVQRRTRHDGPFHSHLPPTDPTISHRGLVAAGLAGGLIPSTSALIILLGSIVAGRPRSGSSSSSRSVSGWPR